MIPPPGFGVKLPLSVSVDVQYTTVHMTYTMMYTIH